MAILRAFTLWSDSQAVIKACQQNNLQLLDYIRIVSMNTTTYII